MKQGILLLGLGLLIGLISGCALLDRQSANRRAATQGLDVALGQLPLPPEFEKVQVIKLEFPRDDLFKESFLARGYIVLGSRLSEQDAINRYYEMVQQFGWVPRSDQYETAKVLFRGSNEAMTIEIEKSPESSEIRNEVDWAELRKKYFSTIVVGIDYRVPGWNQP